MPIINKQLPKPMPVAAADTGVSGLTLLIYGRSKCLGRGTPVLMFDGSIKLVEDIEKGDKLIGPDSKAKEVVSLAVGMGPLYRIVPVKGDSWVCNGGHVLTLTGVCQKSGITRDISVVDYLREQEEGVPWCNYWRLFRVSVDFSSSHEKPLVPPYLVGLWMGDGKRGTSDICNGDEGIFAECKKMARGLGLFCRRAPDHRPNMNTARICFAAHDVEAGEPGNGVIGRNLLRTFFKTCSVGNLKKIPQEYLVASKTNRMELLAGIIDTDGGRANPKQPGLSIVVTGELYRDDLLFLARSLGLAAYSSGAQTYVCENGRVSHYYRVSLSGDLSSIPTKIKKVKERESTRRVLVTGFEVEEEGQGEFFGFELDGDGRFLLGDFTVTHNTGKTRFADTFPKPALLIGTEDGTKSIATSRKEKKKLKCGAIIYSLSLQGKETGTDFVRLQRSAWIDELVEEGAGYRTVIQDHGSGLQDIIMMEVLGLKDVPVEKSWGMAGRDQWQVCGQQTKERLRALINLATRKDINVVVIAHERNFNDDSANSDLVMPTVGAALTPSVTGWLNGACDYICQAFIREQTVSKEFEIAGTKTKQLVRTGKMEYCLRVGPHAVFMTGFRLPPSNNGELPDAIVNPNFAKVAQLIKGSW